MVYETKFTNHSSEEVTFQRGQETSQTFVVKPGQTGSIRTADPKNMWARYRQVIINKGKSIKTHERKRFNDPYNQITWKCEFLNKGGIQFDETIFIDSDEKYYLPRGIKVIAEVNPLSWIGKYRRVIIAEPIEVTKPSPRFPGQFEVIRQQNIVYEERSPEELRELANYREAARKREKL